MKYGAEHCNRNTISCEDVRIHVGIDKRSQVDAITYRPYFLVFRVVIWCAFKFHVSLFQCQYKRKRKEKGFSGRADRMVYIAKL